MPNIQVQYETITCTAHVNMNPMYNCVKVQSSGIMNFHQLTKMPLTCDSVLSVCTARTYSQASADTALHWASFNCTVFCVRLPVLCTRKYHIFTSGTLLNCQNCILRCDMFSESRNSASQFQGSSRITSKKFALQPQVGSICNEANTSSRSSAHRNLQLYDPARRPKDRLSAGESSKCVDCGYILENVMEIVNRRNRLNCASSSMRHAATLCEALAPQQKPCHRCLRRVLSPSEQTQKSKSNSAVQVNNRRDSYIHGHTSKFQRDKYTAKTLDARHSTGCDSCATVDNTDSVTLMIATDSNEEEVTQNTQSGRWW